MAELYPLKFNPILKERVWGGNTLVSKYGKAASPEMRIGESWEISGLQGDLSIVGNGYLAGNNIEEIAEVYMGDLLGDSVYEKYGREFPLLIKLIDASEKLSLQVHPGDTEAAQRHSAYGKTEMWYVIEAENDSFIQTGFKRQTDKNEFFRVLEAGEIDSLMNTVSPGEGDVFYIPAGRVHTLGNGILLAEIQQTSDITYRIHDWNRKGLDGKPRELHADLAEDIIDYSASKDHHKKITGVNNQVVELLSCPYFTTNIIKLDSQIERDYSGLDSFVIFLGIHGKARIESSGETVVLEEGSTVLIPATTEYLKIDSEGASLLEIYIDNNIKEK